MKKKMDDNNYLDSLQRMETELKNYKSFRHDFCKCLYALSDKYSIKEEN